MTQSGSVAGAEAGHVPTPLAQLATGVEAHDIRCNDGRALVISPLQVAACVFYDTVPVLEGRGWVSADPPPVPPPHPATPGKTAPDSSMSGNDTAAPPPRPPTAPGKTAPPVPGIGAPDIPAPVAEANNAFAVDFYKLAAKENGGDKNVFFSPTSMYMAFSVLYEGARGDTASQMAGVFGLDPDTASRHASAERLMATLDSGYANVTVDAANALWLAHWFTPSGHYLDVARTTYRASVETVNFVEVDEDGKKPAVREINSWASEETRGKIKGVIQDKSVGGQTAMVITNAVYFNGTWSSPFPEEDTRESAFHKSGSASVDTDFMNLDGSFKYAHPDGAQVLRIPYAGDDLAMLVILPDADTGLEQLENALSAETVEGWIDQLRGHEVRVSLPKFEAKTKYNLIPPLREMGMPDAFSLARADLQGLLYACPPGDPDCNDGRATSTEQLYVHSASHDAYVRVNEEGTEAAAVTSMVATAVGISAPNIHFNADRPFVFTIYDEGSGAILFMGRMLDPAA